jgi:hypothetical protein
MCHPPAFDANDSGVFEYLEIQNVTRSAVPLYDPAYPTNTWRLRGGVDFEFPTQTVLATGAVLLLVGFDPATDMVSLGAFRAAYSLPPGVVILGPWSGLLNNAGDTIKLEKPAPPAAGTTPYVLVDAVHYRPTAPWPAAADGTGFSLQRLLASAYGNEPTNWCAAAPAPGVGSRVVFPPLELAIGAAGVLSWPAAESDVVLQVTDNLGPSSQWREELSPRTTENGQIKVSISLKDGSQFFRLIRR